MARGMTSGVNKGRDYATSRSTLGYWHGIAWMPLWCWLLAWLVGILELNLEE